MNELLITLLAPLAFLGGIFSPQQEPSLVLGAPTQSARIERTILPETDSLWELGTSTKAWLRIFSDEICLAGDCQTTWPSGGGSFPFTPASWGNSTSSVIGFTQGLFTLGSTTFGGNATTTGNHSFGSIRISDDHIADFAGTNLTVTAGVLNVDNPVVADLTGNVTGNVSGTAGALGADGSNCSAGEYPLGVSTTGASQDCTDATTEITSVVTANFPFTPATSWNSTSTLLQLGGGVMSVSSSSISRLSVDLGTTTDAIMTNATSSVVSVSGHLRSQGTTRLDNMTSALLQTGTTGIVAEYAGTSCTNQVPTALSALGVATCTTLTSAFVDSTIATFGFPWTPATSWNATSTTLLLNQGVMTLASSTIFRYDSVLGTTTSATSSNLHISNGLSFGGVSGDAWTDFCTTITGGAGLCDGTDATGAGSTDVVLWANASTSPWVASSLTALSSSTIAFLDMARATSTDFISTNATSSILSVTSHLRSQGTTRLDNMTSALLLTGSTGIVAEYTGADCTNQVIVDLSVLGAPTCTTITSAYVDSSIITKDNAKWATTTGTFLGISPAGASVVGIGTTTPRALLHLSTTTAVQFALSSGYADTATWFLRSAPNAFYIATTNPATMATSTTASLSIDSNGILTVPNNITTGSLTLTTDLTVANGGSGASTFTDGGVLVGNGASAFTALTVGTNGQLLVGSTGADPVFATANCAVGLTCTLGAGTFQIDVDDSYLLNSGDIGTGVYDFGGATSFEIPNGTAPAVDTTGEIAIDTTSGNLVFATSTAVSIVGASATSSLYAMVMASTSPDFLSGGIIDLPAHFLKQQVVTIMCHVDAGTSVVINLSDGTNDTNTITCTTTRNTYNITSNNIWDAYEAIRLEIGTVTGTVDYLVLRVNGFRYSD